MLEIKQIKKSFEGQEILKGVDRADPGVRA